MTVYDWLRITYVESYSRIQIDHNPFNHKHDHNKEIDHVYILDNGEIRIETVDYVKNDVYQKYKK